MCAQKSSNAGAGPSKIVTAPTCMCEHGPSCARNDASTAVSRSPCACAIGQAYPRRMRPVPLRRVLTVLVLAALVLGCGGGASSAPPAPGGGAAKPGDRFDGARAFAFLERQVQLGP